MYRFFRWLPLSAPAALSLLWPAIAPAQTGDFSTPLSAQAAPRSAAEPYQTDSILADALRSVNWQPEQSGVLIATASISNITPSPTGARTLAEIAAKSQRQIVSLGSVTVLAPQKMMVLNTRPADLDRQYGVLGKSEHLQLLLNSFSTEQWDQIASAGGIGKEQLSDEQWQSLAATLPANFSVVRLPQNASSGVTPGQPPVPVSESQRDQIRLRLDRTLLAQYSAGATSVMSNLSRRLGAGPVGEVATQPLQPASATPTGAENPAPGAVYKGPPVVEWKPNALKQSDLDLESGVFAKTVQVQQAKTIGDLIAMVRAAIGVEMYADRRVAALPIWISGSSAKAKDVLLAVRWATSTTFRKVGPAYVLTDDIAGIGTRIAALNAWAVVLRQAKAELVNNSKLKKPPLSWARVPFPASAAFALPETMNAALEKAAGGSATFALDQLPQTLQQAVKDDASFWSGNGRQIDTSRVQLQLQPTLSILVPGVGAVTDPQIPPSLFSTLVSGSGVAPATDAPVRRIEAAPAPPSEPVAWPSGFQKRICCITASTTAEVETLAQEAQKAGFTQIWLSVPMTARITGIASGGTGSAEVADFVKSSVEIARQHGMTLVPLLSPFRHPDLPLASNALQDRTIHGLSASEYTTIAQKFPNVRLNSYLQYYFSNWKGWVSPDAAAWARYCAAAHQVSLTPGIAGMAFQNTAAPDYANPGDGSREWLSDSVEFGYTEPLRLAYLREVGIDPIDIATPQDDFQNVIFSQEKRPPSLSFPFFPTNFPVAVGKQTLPSPLRAWMAYRNGVNERQMRELFTAVEAAEPLLVADRPDDPMTVSSGWFSPVTSTSKLSHIPSGLVHINYVVIEASGGSEERLLRLSATPLDAPKSLAEGLVSQPISAFRRRSLQARPSVKSVGIVLDLGNLSVKRQREVLSSVANIGTTANQD